MSLHYNHDNISFPIQSQPVLLCVLLYDVCYAGKQQIPIWGIEDLIPGNLHQYVVSEWFLFNANSAIFQLYHGENKLIFHEMIMRSTLY